MIAPCVRIHGASRGALYATPAGAATPVALPAVSFEGQPLRSHQGSPWRPRGALSEALVGAHLRWASVEHMQKNEFSGKTRDWSFSGGLFLRKL